MNKREQYKRIWAMSMKGMNARIISGYEDIGYNAVRYILIKIRSMGLEGAIRMRDKSCAICGKVSEWKYCERCQPNCKGRDRVRHLVRARDKFSCQDCGKVVGPGSGRQLDVHHLHGECGKKSRGYDRVSEMDGLVTLCHKCHFNRHDHSHRNKEGKYVVGKKKQISKRPSKAVKKAK